MHFRKITGAAVWIIDWSGAREPTEKACRAAGVARRGHSQEIFRIQNQQDLMPYWMGQEGERGSRMLLRCHQLSWRKQDECIWESAGEDEDLISR